MNQMETFKNPEFGSIRVVEENGKYLFCGADAARALGYARPNEAVSKHCKGTLKRRTPTTGGIQEMLFIPEGDLYRLIVHSKLPSAEQFEQWVFDEVLPTIRKHGAYLTKEKMWEVATSPEALMKLCSDLLAEREANVSLRKENAQLEGKAAFYDLVHRLKAQHQSQDYCQRAGCAGAPVCPVSSGKAVCVPHCIRQCSALCQCEKYGAVLCERLLQSRAYRLLHAGYAQGKNLFCPAAGNDFVDLIRTERKWVLCQQAKQSVS